MNQSTTRKGRRRHAPSTVAALRSLMPDRALSFGDARTIAELQAHRLLKLTASMSAPISDSVITELPHIDVQHAGSLIGSGATAWSGGQWCIRLNSGEPPTRQRFTLAHELKHILDAASEDVIYGHLPGGTGRERFIEAVCDHFAACLLMPKALVKRLWGQGIQDLSGLAWRFEVSQQAMLIRLQYLGLVEPLPRCVSWQHIGTVAVRGARQHPRRPRSYRRPVADRRYARASGRPRPLPVLQGVSP